VLCRNGYSEFFGRSARWDMFRYLIENFATFSGISAVETEPRASTACATSELAMLQ
jgi:hypothetical protein